MIIEEARKEYIGKYGVLWYDGDECIILGKIKEVVSFEGSAIQVGFSEIWGDLEKVRKKYYSRRFSTSELKNQKYWVWLNDIYDDEALAKILIMMRE